MGRKEHQPSWWLPTLRGRQERLYHDQGLLHGRPKATNPPPKDTLGSLQAKGLGEDRPQEHRYHLQVRSRSIPDHQGEAKVQGTTQEGKARLRRHRKLNLSRCNFVLSVRF